MTAIKRAALVLTLMAIITLIVVVVRLDGVPPLPVPDLLERQWGQTEPLKQHTQERVRDIDAELANDAR